MDRLMIIAAAAMLCAACSNSKKSAEPMADSGRTQRTEALLSSLKQMGA